MIRNLIILLASLWVVGLQGQDEKFSQFYAIPIHVNPALTGAYDGTYRLTAIYRDQWYNNLGSSFKTFAAGGDTRFQLKFGRNRVKDHFGVGLFFVSDRLTEFQSTNNKISAYFAYHKQLTEKTPSYIGAGIQLGVIQRNINYDNLTFGDQFNQLDAFDQPTGETLPPNNIGVFNFSVGINYYIKLEKSTYYLGAAAHHLNQPNISYFARLDNVNPSTITDQILPTRYVAHLSMDTELQYRLEFQPRLIYQRQGQDNSINLGTNFEYTFKTDDLGLVMGAWVNILNDIDGTRLSHVTPLVGLIRGAFIFGFSYDWGLQDAFNNPFNLNTFEFSIRFSGEHFNDSGLCPSF